MKHHVDCMLHVASFFFYFFYSLSQYATISFYSTIESFTSATDNGKAIASSCIASFDFSAFFFRVFSSVLEEYPNDVFVNKC